MPTDDRTTNQNFPRPHVDNTVSEDFARIITLVNMLDSEVTSLEELVAGKAATGHGHVIEDVDGLQGALDAKKALSWFPALGELTNVNVAGAVTGQLLGFSGSTWQPMTLSVAWGNVSGKPSSFPSTWDDVADKPSTFAPAAHSHPATSITSSPTGSLAGTTVQDALAELDAEKLALSGGTLTGVLVTPVGSAGAPALTSVGDTDTGVFYPAANTLGLATGGVERARVDASGNVGIGITPTSKLHVNGDTKVEGNFILGVTPGGVSSFSAGQGDDASPTACNSLIKSWWGVGISPTITGQPVPFGENSHWFDARNGDIGFRGALRPNNDAGTTTKVMTGGAPSSWQEIGALVAGIAYDGLGTYGIFAYTVGALAQNQSVAASTLHWAGCLDTPLSGVQPESGTWRSQGRVYSANYSCLFKRIA